MSQWKYKWKASKNQIKLVIDLSDVDSKYIADYTGGMGIRIENSKDKIQSVQINEKHHPAYSDNVVILPNLKPGKNEILIRLGPEFVHHTRLTFVSKRMPSIRIEEQQIEVRVLTKSKAKFSFYVEKPFVLLNADWQAWDFSGDLMLHGYTTSNRRLILKKLSGDNFCITRSTLPIRDFSIKNNLVLLILGESVTNERTLWFKSSHIPKRLLLNNHTLSCTKHGKIYKIAFPEIKKTSILKVEF